jgi:hypothetical protein
MPLLASDEESVEMAIRLGVVVVSQHLYLVTVETN